MTQQSNWDSPNVSSLLGFTPNRGSPNGGSPNGVVQMSLQSNCPCSLKQSKRRQSKHHRQSKWRQSNHEQSNREQSIRVQSKQGWTVYGTDDKISKTLMTLSVDLQYGSRNCYHTIVKLKRLVSKKIVLLSFLSHLQRVLSLFSKVWQ